MKTYFGENWKAKRRFSPGNVPAELNDAALLCIRDRFIATEETPECARIKIGRLEAGDCPAFAVLNAGLHALAAPCIQGHIGMADRPDLFQRFSGRGFLFVLPNEANKPVQKGGDVYIELIREIQEGETIDIKLLYTRAVKAVDS